tara:strand:+ start:667 stop:885 length:219 start_codon:yes stop_codon:yes gene_type:complete
MNDQIESYLKQHHVLGYFNSYGKMVEDEHYFMYREDLQGLVELIVRECVLISRTSTDGFSAGQRMEEHFGVE